MSSKVDAGVTIGDAAAATGVAAATIRAWELRHGFPRPHRVPSGHRRYSRDQVEGIRAVVEHRRRGLSLEAAIELASRPEPAPERSLFAGIHRRHPDLPIHVLAHRSMLAISRAIEDECCAQADGPVLVASFQHERRYRRSEARWRELSRTAACAVVLADFANDTLPTAGPLEVALGPREPLLREWAVVCDAPHSAACLVGWERPAASDRGGHPQPRAFEAFWSVEPSVVRDAARIAMACAVGRAPHLATVAAGLAGEAAIGDPVGVVRRMTAVTNRVVAYLQDAPGS